MVNSFTEILNIISNKLIETKLSFIASNKYLFSLFILILIIIIAKLIYFIAERYIKWVVSKTKTSLDDEILKAIKKPIFYLILLLGLYLSLVPLGISEKFLSITNNIIFSIMTIISTLALVAIIDTLITEKGKIWAKKTKSNIDDELLPLFHKTSKILFFLFSVLFILNLWGVNITGFLAGLGIAGIAIGFALKDSLANIFGGISLILDKSIKVGDRIKLESGVIGEVEEVGLRSTKMRSFDNELLIIPNGNLANQIVQNYTLPNNKLRIQVFFGVEYGSNIDKVKEVVSKALNNIKEISKDPSPDILFIEMADSSLNFRCNIWVDDYKDAFSTKIKSTEEIYNALNKFKIGIPFPCRNVYLHK